MKSLKLFFMVMFSFFGLINADHFDIGECKVFGSTVISTWVKQDANGYHTYGAVGNFGDPPNLWTVQEITADNPAAFVSTPQLYMNAIGDVVAVWGYYDNLLKIVRVAAARLENSQTTWVVDVISDNNPLESVRLGHINAELSDSGNILVAWTSFEYVTNTLIIRGAEGTITGIWGAPVQLGL